MFVMDLEPTFTANVPIPAPGGKVQVVRVNYNYLEPAEYDKTVVEMREKPLVDLVSRLVCGWEEKDGKDFVGMPLPYGRDALETLAKRQPRALRAIMNAYQAEAFGFSLGN